MAKRSVVMKQPDRLVNYWKKESAVVLTVILSGVLYNVGLLAGPFFQGKLLDALVEMQPLATLAIQAAVFTGAITLVQFFRYIKRFYIRRFANNVSATMRVAVYNSLIHQERREIEGSSIGSIMTKAVSDVDACTEGMRKFTTEVFDTGVAFAAYIVMLCVYDIRITVLAGMFIPVAMLIAEKLKTVVCTSNADYRHEMGKLSGMTYDMLDNAMLYRLYGREDDNYRKYAAENAVFEKKAVRANIWENSMQPVYNVIAMLGVGFVIFLGGQKVIDGAWSVGTFSTYMTVFAAMAVKAGKTSKLFNSMQRAIVSWRRLKPHLQEHRETEKIMPAVAAVRGTEASGAAVLKLENVKFERQPHKLNLTAAAGETVGVTGPVACGKTTLASAFLGAVQYTGKIEICGRNLADMGEYERSQTIAYMGHAPQLLSDTIFNNIVLGDEADAANAAIVAKATVGAAHSENAAHSAKATANAACASPADGDAAQTQTQARAAVMQLLETVCFTQDLETMKDGIDTAVGSGGIRLSGGQQARIALARALYHRKKLLVLDDPFSAVDVETERQITENLRRLCKEQAIIIFSHRLAMFDTFDKVIVMHPDAPYEYGTHAELIKTSALYNELYRLQTGGNTDEK